MKPLACIQHFLKFHWETPDSLAKNSDILWRGGGAYAAARIRYAANQDVLSRKNRTVLCKLLLKNLILKNVFYHREYTGLQKRRSGLVGKNQRRRRRDTSNSRLSKLLLTNCWVRVQISVARRFKGWRYFPKGGHPKWQLSKCVIFQETRG